MFNRFHAVSSSTVWVAVCRFTLLKATNEPAIDRAVKTENNCFDAELLAELAQMFGQNERGKLAVTWGKAMRKANTTTSILNLTNAQPK